MNGGGVVVNSSILTDPAFAALSSKSKVWVYRQLGWEVGHDVTIGAGTVIEAKGLFIGDGVTIGANCSIRGTGIRLDRMVQIGDHCKIDTRMLKLGDVTCLGDNVKIAGANRYGPRAGFWCGHTNMISDDCYIDTGEGVTFGNEVCLCNRVMVYTHSQWLSVLDGYPATFRSVTLGDRVHVGAGVIIPPNANIPHNCKVTGSKLGEDIHASAGALSHRSQIRILERLLGEFGAETGIQTELLADSLADSWSIRCGAVIFDLDKMVVRGQTRDADKLRNFLRRRGIRFQPIHWRYKDG